MARRKGMCDIYGPNMVPYIYIYRTCDGAYEAHVPKHDSRMCQCERSTVELYLGCLFLCSGHYETSLRCESVHTGAHMKKKESIILHALTRE